jgi:UDP-GlcNAc:undecaprenyl-phosphate/decaprenyl-phosphate GlcNAc-1-phosphate transferase
MSGTMSMTQPGPVTLIAMGGGSLVATLALTPVVIWAFSTRGILDHPTARSSHDRPVVRGVGLAPAVVALIGWLLIYLLILAILRLGDRTAEPA